MMHLLSNLMAKVKPTSYYPHMHELSLAQALTEQVTRLAKADEVKKVKSITISIGALSGVVKDSMEFCYSEAIKGTFIEGSELIVEEIPLTVLCKQCNKETTPDRFQMSCVHCNSNEVEITKGKEFKLISMEVE